MQPETQRRSCFACRIPTEAKLARNHHPASNYSHPFANMLQLPILDLFFFSLNNRLKARSLYAQVHKNSKSPGVQREGARRLLPPPWRVDAEPEGDGSWGTMLKVGGRCCRLGDNAGGWGTMQLSSGSSTRPGLCS